MSRFVAVSLGVLWAAAIPALARADVPTPVVAKMASERPGSPGRNYPFFATDIVLENYGYVEEEFSFDGTAHTYSTPEMGANAEITASGIKYRSRMLVRRPATASRFNGVVLVEWLNVTNGYDTDVLWLYQKEFFVREGYAWVGVSVQDGGVSRPPNGIKVWSPARYGSLDLTGGGAVTDASLNFDIYAQAAAAVRHVPAVLGGLRPQLVIAAGQSQSAGRLGPYLNGVHPREPVYDAALLTVNNQPMRTDLAIPVIKVLSETERATSRSQPDSARVRVWTVAGATHSEQYSLLSRAAFLLRDLNLPAVDACETPARSRVEIRYVYNAAVDWLVRWTRSGAEPPHAPPLEFDETAVEPTPNAPAAGATAAPDARGPAGAGAARGGRGGGGRGSAEKPVRRDQHGNVLGGIRLAEIAVPVAKESAESCGLGGTHVPFDAATLNRLYPTHADYVSKVTRVAQDLVKAGFMLKADAAQTIDSARRSIHGAQLVCGPLCADERQFSSHPSTTLLAKQTSFLMIKGGEALVVLADRATRLVAEGDTVGGAVARGKYADAVAQLRRYVQTTHQLASRRRMAPETERLLADQANVLIARLSP